MNLRDFIDNTPESESGTLVYELNPKVRLPEPQPGMPIHRLSDDGTHLEVVAIVEGLDEDGAIIARPAWPDHDLQGFRG